MRFPAIHVVGVALLLVTGSCATNRPVQDVGAPGAIDSSKRMPDGKRWTTTNLNLDLMTGRSWHSTMAASVTNQPKPVEPPTSRSRRGAARASMPS